MFETHAHYDDPVYDADRRELMAQIERGGVTAVINVSSDIGTAAHAVGLSRTYGFVRAAAGFHPHCAHKITEADFDAVSALAGLSEVVAIGECGLDYHFENTDKKAQIFWFNRQLDLAAETRKPVIIHSRDAENETYEILKSRRNKLSGGVLHCFSSDAQAASNYIKMGFFIGVGGIVTFKNAERLAQAVRAIPIEHILLETDCPYLSPEPRRGERNSSLNLRFIAEKIAQIKDMSFDSVVQTTSENARKLFCLP